MTIRPTVLTVRRRLVKGWAFRNHPPETVAKIQAFLKTGDPAYLKGTMYEGRKLEDYV